MEYDFTYDGVYVVLALSSIIEHKFTYKVPNNSAPAFVVMIRNCTLEFSTFFTYAGPHSSRRR